jgi:membrane-bound lytic murein transglycosylase D
LIKSISLISILFFLNSCSSITPLRTNNLELPELSTSDSIIDGRSKTKIELLTTDTNKLKSLRKTKVKMPALKKEEVIPTPIIPIMTGSKVFDLKYPKKLYKFWMNYYLKRDMKRLQRHMNRGHKVETIVRETFRKHNLPEELFYVGLIESGYNERISSHANAVGPWQFIKGTATRYGLRVDRYVDERYNIVKATEAAAQYFKDLYNIFGSWELALSAYNAGEYRIINAIRRGNSRDYRVLVKKKLLPKETIYYVPKVMAAKNIYEKKRHYGFHTPLKRNNPFKNVSESKFTSSFSLKKIAKKIGVSYKKLKTINPDVKTGWVHLKRGRSHKLLVPNSLEAKASRVAISHREKRSASSKRKLASLEKKISKAKRVALTKSAAYRVQKGDNLSKISRLFNTKISKIKRANGLRSSRVMVGQRLRIPGLVAKTYTVRKGDNLGGIARRFKTSIASIKGLNGLKNSRIYPKQKIQIPSNS